MLGLPVSVQNWYLNSVERCPTRRVYSVTIVVFTGAQSREIALMTIQSLNVHSVSAS
jgi:hypothetical protein